MSQPSFIRQASEGELREVIATEFERFPALRSYRDRACCPGCLYAEIGQECGWDAAVAWERVSGALWLLGDETDQEEEQ